MNSLFSALDKQFQYRAKGARVRRYESTRYIVVVECAFPGNVQVVSGIMSEFGYCCYSKTRDGREYVLRFKKSKV